VWVALSVAVIVGAVLQVMVIRSEREGVIVARTGEAVSQTGSIAATGIKNSGSGSKVGSGKLVEDADPSRLLTMARTPLSIQAGPSAILMQTATITETVTTFEKRNSPVGILVT
jgi:hypothetical protein